MSVQSGQDNYNKNTRPAKLAEKHENTIKQIKELQELERYMFANLQGINKSSPDANEQEERIRRRIQELVTIRQNLFGKLRGMYTSTQINVTKSREDLADQIAVGKTMEDELKNTEEQLEVLRAERANKMKMVEIGQYEYERYNELRGIMKNIVYGIFIVLIISFLMRQSWFPRIVGVALIALVIVGTIVTVAGRIYYNMRRNDRNYSRLDQEYGGVYNKVVIPQQGAIGEQKGLLSMLTCANASSAYSSTVAAAEQAAANQAAENFAVMGSLAAHDGSSSRYSYLN
jgi:hypothetical protein